MRASLSVVVGLALFFAGCTHTVTVYTIPEGAQVFVNGRPAGRSPTIFQERSGYHKKFRIRAELEGYEPWTEEHEQKEPSNLLVPSVVGAYFLLFPIIGVLWGYQLEDQITLTLKPLAEAEEPPAAENETETGTGRLFAD